jgi:hypothetical protein
MLDAGCWILVTGCMLLAARGGQRAEYSIRNDKLKIRNDKCMLFSLKFFIPCSSLSDCVLRAGSARLRYSGRRSVRLFLLFFIPVFTNSCISFWFSVRWLSHLGGRGSGGRGREQRAKSRVQGAESKGNLQSLIIKHQSLIIGQRSESLVIGIIHFLGLKLILT